MTIGNYNINNQMDTSRFATVPTVDIQRSTFDRTHEHKTTFDSGLLIPFYTDEMLPGDTFKGKVFAFARMSTPLTPIFDNLYMDFQFWVIPNRLVYNKWKNLQGEQENPGDSTDYTVPAITGTVETGSLADYMKLPLGESTSYATLHARAYNLVYNTCYRDQNLQDSVEVKKDETEDLWEDYQIFRRGKRKDYFTSALPFPQKGDPVLLSLGESAPITGDAALSSGQVNSTQSIRNIFTSPTTNTARVGAGGSNYTAAFSIANTNVNINNLEADLSNAPGIAINDIRTGFQLQRAYEKDARGGTRYNEAIASRFKTVSPDARLQRPEYIGGGSIPITVTPIAQTSISAGESPLGTTGAVAFAQGHNVNFEYSAVEHMVVLGIVSIRANMTYQQGMPRMYSRKTRFDFYEPVFAHLGEQSVLNKEIYHQNTAQDDEVFGYQERWAEYRYASNVITGKFRSDAPLSLDVWHLSQYFSELPILGDTFIKENPPVKRVQAIQDEPEFIFDSNILLKCARPMPVHSVPGMIDHY